MDVRYAWGIDKGGDYNGRGKGITVCDVENGYYSGHDNLPDVAHVDPEQELASDDPDHYHGTKTIGVLGSPKTGGVGTIGICHEATIVFSPSGDDDFSADVHTAVQTALLHLTDGDVLVIESQLSIDNENDRFAAEYVDGEPWVEILRAAGEPNLVPAEANADVLEAFNRAAEDGIAVVQAAGNSGFELAPIITKTTTVTESVTESGTESVSVSVEETMWSPTGDESLAIIVGSGDPDDHRRVTGNYGPRVNCQGWGVDVHAPTSKEDEDKVNHDERNWYVESFGDTSSATAIIGGLVACLQGAYRAVRHDTLHPFTIRQLLSCPALGNPDPEGEIGPLPDLHRILCHEEIVCVEGESPVPASWICPDVFVRDHLTDVGTPTPEFTAGMYPTLLNRSPDVLLLNAALADPDVDFGPGTWMVETPSKKAKSGTNFFYVRAGNRGEGPDGAKIEVYVSEPSAFLHPRYWQLVAATSLELVPPMNMVVAPTMSWDAPFLSAPAPYSQIVLLKPYRGPVPAADATWTSSQFRDFARRTNDVCFRSVQTESTGPNGAASFRCQLRGLPERPEALSFKVLSLLPPGTTLTITPYGDLTSTRSAALTLVDGVPHTIPVLSGWLEYAFPAGADIAVDIKVKMNSAAPGRYETTVDQWDRSAHLGRITFVVVVPPPA